MKKKIMSRAESLTRRLADAAGLKIIKRKNQILVYSDLAADGLCPIYSSWDQCLFGSNVWYGFTEIVPDYSRRILTGAWQRLRSFNICGSTYDEIELQMAAHGI